MGGAHTIMKVRLMLLFQSLYICPLIEKEALL